MFVSVLCFGLICNPRSCFFSWWLTSFLNTSLASAIFSFFPLSPAKVYTLARAADWATLHYAGSVVWSVWNSKHIGTASKKLLLNGIMFVWVLVWVFVVLVEEPYQETYWSVGPVCIFLPAYRYLSCVLFYTALMRWCTVTHRGHTWLIIIKCFANAFCRRNCQRWD